LLTHEPQNREMALIRCPSCDTLHELEGSFFAAGPRKVRCAACREVWEAQNPESPAARIPIAPVRETAPDLPEPDGEDAAALDQAAIDAMDFSPEPPAMPAAAESKDGGEPGLDISPEELEALFASEAAAEPPKPDESTQPSPARPSLDDIPVFDPESLARAQDATLPPPPPDDPDERRRMRREQRLAATEAHHKHAVKPARRAPIAAMAMAAGIGTLATIGFLHDEVTRLFPASAPLFSAIGLGKTSNGLDIAEVRSKLIVENERETLEVSGTIANVAPDTRKVPVLRLSIRSATGQEIYVWTATADRLELAPGEKTEFRRRLASPPAGAHSVLVRFVARDDIVAAMH